VEIILYCGQMSHGTWGCIASVWCGSQSAGLALLVVGFSCVDKYIALLISSLGVNGAAPSTRLMKVLSLWHPVHDLASARRHEWLATCVPVQSHKAS